MSNLKFCSNWKLTVERTLRRQLSPSQGIFHRRTSTHPSTEYFYQVEHAHHRSAGASPPMKSSPFKTLLVAEMEGKRLGQITLWLVALPLTFHGPNQVTWSCLTSKGVGRCNPTMCQEKRRGSECLLSEPRVKGFQIWQSIRPIQECKS